MMMKRMIAGCLAALLLCAALPAGAEIVGRSGDEFIHRYIAPNGQEIYFTSWEEEPPLEFKDVNGDGAEDIVIVTAIGASNAVYAFWVWDGEQYAWAMENCPDYGLYNYGLTEDGRVVSRANNGYAGALFSAEIYGWDGPRLKLLRKMVSDNNAWLDMTEGMMTEYTELERLRIRLWDYTGTASDLEEPVWEKLVPLEDMSADMFNEIEERLTEGLDGQQ